MRAMTMVAAREIRERWSWLGLSVIVGLLSLLGTRIGLRGEALANAAMALFGIVALLSSVVLGASVMAGDLVQGRLGFLLARPISWWSIWGGKLTAAVVLCAFSVLAGIPGLIAARGLAGAVHAVLDLRAAALFAAQVVVAVVLAQAAAIAFRSRSAWTALDLGALAAAVYFGVKVLDVLGMSGAFVANTESSLFWLAGIIAAALLILSAAPFAFGGTSIHRAHAALSVAACVSVLVALTGGAAWGYWAGHPGAEDFKLVSTVSGNERWIGVVGYARGRYDSNALFYRGDGNRPPQLVGSTLMMDHTLALSADGNTAAWLELVPGLPRRVRVMCARGGADRVQARALPVPPAEPFQLALSLSPKGDRLATQEERQVRVYDVSTGRLVASVALPLTLGQGKVAFRDDDTVMVYGRTSEKRGSLQIVEASVGAGRARVTGTVDYAGVLNLDAAGRRLLVTDVVQKTLRLHDATSGALLGSLTSYTGAIPASAFVGEEVAVLQSSGGGTLLRLFSGTGHVSRALDLGPAAWSRLDVDRQGNLLVGLKHPVGGYETLVVRPDTLEVAQHIGGLMPLVAPWTELRRDSGSGLFRDLEQRVVRIDGAGRRQVVIGPRG